MNFYYNLQYITSIILALTEYILSGIAFMKLAKDRGMGNPWLAWIPFTNVHLIGAIADQTSGQHKRKPKALGLLILSIAYTVTYLTSFCFPWDNLDYNYFILYSTIINLAIGAIKICYIGFLCISFYDIFKEYTPRKASTYILISIISVAFGFSFVPAIIILIVCKNIPLKQLEYTQKFNNYQAQQDTQQPY